MPLPIIQIKWTTFKRLTKQIPFVYLLIIVSSFLGLAYFLTRLNIEASWQTVSIASAIYIILFTRIEYKTEQRLLLKQYPKAFYTSVAIDALLISAPFYFMNIISGITTSMLALVLSLVYVKYEGKPKINPVVPSPFFIKGSYMWHSKVRYLLPMVWLVSLLLIVVARVHDNYNLATVSLGVGALISFASTIMQSEDQSFVQIYLNKKHFIKTNLKETIYNSMIFALPMVTIMIMLFPSKWYISLILLVTIIVITVMLNVTKYAFYPSLTLAIVMFVIGVFAVGALAISLYGIALIPIYFAVLYYQYSKNISKLLNGNEETKY